MNRRGFITKILASLAALPVVGKLAQAEPRWITVGDDRIKPDFQFVTSDRLTGGTFRMTMNGCTSPPLSYDVTGEEARAAYDALWAGSRR